MTITTRQPSRAACGASIAPLSDQNRAEMDRAETRPRQAEDRNLHLSWSPASGAPLAGTILALCAACLLQHLHVLQGSTP